MRLGRTADAKSNGQQLAVAALALLALLLLLAPRASGAGTLARPQSTFVPTELHDAAVANPDQVFRVIVQGTPSTSTAGVQAGVQDAFNLFPAPKESVNGAFTSIKAVSAEITGEQLQMLASSSNIYAITPDMPVRASVADPPVALEPPVVTGSTVAGSALSATPGQWAGLDLTFAYQWQRCNTACSDIAGATASSYTASNDDVGATLDVTVTATNVDGSGSSTSAATAAVTAPAPAPVPLPPSATIPPSVSGTAVEGSTLTADDGVWSDVVTLSRQWQRCPVADVTSCVDIAGETGTTYLLGTADVGSTLRVVVSATDSVGTGLAASTASDVVAAMPTADPPPAPPAAPPTALTPPAVTGIAAPGEVLTASDGTWSDLVGITRQWERCAADGTSCVAVVGATGTTYVLGDADTGFTVRVVVTGTNAGGSTAVASEATAVVTAPAPPPPPPPPPPAPGAPTVLVPPALTGTATEGETLSVDGGVWSDAAAQIALQWQRCSSPAVCVDIDAAVKPTYTLGLDDVGQTLRVTVTATDAFGSGTAQTGPTDIVAAAPPPPPTVEVPVAVVQPSIGGVAKQGELLTANDGQWTAATTIARQWQRCAAGGTCADIAGETGSTYLLGAADVGATITVVVTATSAAGPATATAAPTAAVAAPDTAPPAPTPPPPPPPATPPSNLTLPTTSSRPPMAQTQETATAGTWQFSGAEAGYAYSWERCDQNGANCAPVGATTPVYTPTNTDVGSTLRVVVTATDSNGLSATATSAVTDRVAPYSASGLFSWQLGPYAAKLDAPWDAVTTANAKLPTIAIVDSGVDRTLPGLGRGQVMQQVPMTTLAQRDVADGYGHGSFVAQVAAGNARGAAGAAPGAPIVSLDVMDDNGMALTSAVVAAADWIYTHKDNANIRVANFSLIGSTPSSVMFDPLDRALERLWFSGVVVVTAAGNFAVDGQPSDVPYSPANDPFVLTVGATDTANTVTDADDFAAPWSAYGHTLDGFAKPEIGAPGRYVVASVPTDSTLYTSRPDRIVGPGQLELSGTSFAAPMVSGVAADLLALHPTWTPDQVKGALMLSAAPAGAASLHSLGVGDLDAAAALGVTSPPNANEALQPFVVADPAGGPTPVFDTASWGTTAQANASWGTASWGTASWGTASWGTASWGTTYWSSASWGTASWGTASWGTASWGTASWGTDNSNADVLPGGAYWMRWGS